MRTRLADRRLPDYTRGEELFNMVSHIVGGGLGVIFLAVLVFKTALDGNIYGVVSSVIYGAAMVLLYTMSSVYHGLKHETAKKVMQVLDHCAIYILIAGTYTPIALGPLRAESPALGWATFAAEWVLAALAITLTAIDLKKFGVFSMICYIFMGWGVTLFYKQAISALTLNGFLILLAGGLFYTAGAVIYGIGKKKRYMHNVFHVFVLLGGVIHFFAVFFYAV